VDADLVAGSTSEDGAVVWRIGSRTTRVELDNIFTNVEFNTWDRETSIRRITGITNRHWTSIVQCSMMLMSPLSSSKKIDSTRHPAGFFCPFLFCLKTVASSVRDSLWR
jgi:hypothetical protein